jgi:hypothetical protein
MNTIVFYNGSIYTLDATQPQVRALAVRDGRVLAVGTEGRVQAAAGGRAEMVNLQGRALIPGLCDAHVHITAHGVEAQRIKLEDLYSVEAVLRRVAAHSKQFPGEGWLRGGGWSQGNWGGRWPTRQELDSVVSERPAFLTRRDMHSAWVNSRALQLAGIDDTTPDPPGGQIQRDAEGQATGILLESAMDLVRGLMPLPTAAERRAALRAALDEAVSYGLTSLHIPPGADCTDARDMLSDLQLLRQEGRLTLRCLVHLGVDQLDEAIALGLRSGLGDEWLRIGSLKIFADGTLGSETAEMLYHYEGRRHLGLAFYSAEELNALVRKANLHGISVIVHAIGDAANRKVLDAIEAAQLACEDAGQGLPPLPNRIEHVQVLHAKDVERFAALKIVASMQPKHATSDYQVADELWGSRCNLAYAWRTLKQAGTVLAFGSDAPVEPLNPWLGIHAAVTRQRSSGEPAGGWYPEQCLSVAETLEAHCIGPAIASAETRFKGMLTPGALADMVVLSADPFRARPQDLHAISALQTYVGGRIVYERSQE